MPSKRDAPDDAAITTPSKRSRREVHHVLPSPPASPPADDRFTSFTPTLNILSETKDSDLLLSCVDPGLQLLENLHNSIKIDTNFEILDPTRKALSQIQEVLETPIKAYQPETIVGVLGDTGVGKSSLINALLDYSQIAPTGGSGSAITACVTEFRWPEKSKEEKIFKARVEYVTLDELMVEVDYLVSDILGALDEGQDDKKSGKRARRDTSNRAWERILSFLPTVRKEDIWGPSELDPREQFDDPALVATNALKELAEERLPQLGTVETFTALTEEAFYRKVQGYTSTKEVAVDTDEDEEMSDVEESDEEDEGNTMSDVEEEESDDEDEDYLSPTQELRLRCSRSLVWPLVKRVKVYLKADILRNGTVLVDLPGSGDSNIGRARVAKEYESKCNAIMLVLSSIRAKDNKILKNFMESKIAQRLAMDGMMGSTTIICTKTDQTNAQTALQENNVKQSRRITELLANVKAANAQLKADTTRQRNLKKTQKQLVGKKVDETLSEVFKEAFEVDTRIREISAGIKLNNRRLEAAVIKTTNANLKHLLKEEFAKHGRRKPTIFTVSAREYQRLRPELCNDNDGDDDEEEVEEAPQSACFEDIRGTEIPRLRDHIIRRGTQSQERGAKHFIRSALQPILRSLHGLYHLNRQELDQKLRDEIEGIFSKRVGEMGDKLTSSREEMYDKILKSVSKISKAAEDIEGIALDSAQKTIPGWRQTTQNGEGYHWRTFKATCVRKGEFRNINLNEELMDPMVSGIAGPWETSLQDDIPEIVKDWNDVVKKTLLMCHDNVKSDIRSFEQLKDLDEQLRNIDGDVKCDVEVSLHRIKHHILKPFHDDTRELNADIVSLARRELKDVYRRASAEVGRGLYARMLNMFSDQMNDTSTFYSTCREKLWTRLSELVEGINEKASEKVVGKLKGSMGRAYEGILKTRDGVLETELAVAKRRVNIKLRVVEMKLKKIVKEGQGVSEASRGVGRLEVDDVVMLE